MRQNFTARTATNPRGRRHAPPTSGHNSGVRIEHLPLTGLKLDPTSARAFSASDEKKSAHIILRYGGLREPLIVSADGTVLIGELLYLGAIRASLEHVPVIRLEDLGEHEARALSVAYTRLGELGRTDKAKLGLLIRNFEAHIPNFETEDIAYEVAEIDLAINAIENSNNKVDEQLDELTSANPVSQAGDIWTLGKHRVACGDATNQTQIHTLMAGASAFAVFSDPPFGCQIDGFVASAGRHREFVMASGEMTQEEMKAFFESFIKVLLSASKPGAVVYLVIDWRSLHLLLDATTPHLGSLVNMAVWIKDRAGLGSFLRSQHELVLIFKTPGGRARNNVMLGKFGRDRSNVWSYPSAKTASKGSDEGDMLAHHPTPKPVRMVADALLDSTKRGDIVLDLFLGSGTTLIAAEKIGRVCYACDLDPLYVDLAVRRWQQWTGADALLERTGETFAAVAANRNPNN